MKKTRPLVLVVFIIKREIFHRKCKVSRLFAYRTKGKGQRSGIFIHLSCLYVLYISAGKAQSVLSLRLHWSDDNEARVLTDVFSYVGRCVFSDKDSANLAVVILFRWRINRELIIIFREENIGSIRH